MNIPHDIEEAITIKKAASKLSSSSQTFTEADIYKQALNGRLVLSLKLREDHPARPDKELEAEDSTVVIEKISSSQLWDLVVIDGTEDFLHYEHDRTRGIYTERRSEKAFFIENLNGERFYLIEFWKEFKGACMAHFTVPNIPPMMYGNNLPDQSEIVVRIKYLLDFILSEMPNHQTAEEFVDANRHQTPQHELIAVLKQKYGLRGQAIHDLIWPDHTNVNASTKRSRVRRARKES